MVHFISTLFTVSILAFGFNATATTAILDLRAIDTNINPCDDFYGFACGNWVKQTNIPSDKAIIYRQSEELENQSWIELRQLIESPKASAKLKNFYQACTKPPQQMSPFLQLWLKKIGNIKSTEELAFVTGQLHTLNINAFFNLSAWQDLDTPTRTIVYLSQGGMALPERDYYLKQDKEARDLRRKYQTHISEIFRLSRLQANLPSIKSASDIYSIEKALAEKSLPLEDQWTPSIIKNKVSVPWLKRRFSQWNWDLYFNGLGLKFMPVTINLNEPAFFSRLDLLVRTENLQTLKSYLLWQVLHQASPLLSAEFESSYFNFWQKELYGVQQPKPLWQRCVQQSGDQLRDLLGKSYVESLPEAEATKSAVNQIIDASLDIFAESLPGISWIDAKTQEGARAKLENFGRKVAFPDSWESYEGLIISSTDRLANDYSTENFSRKKELARIDHYVVNKEWSMAPWEINAYYDPSLNEFAFPFGILRPPAFDLQANDAINMGVFGSLVGHEMLHAFDTDGSQYDEKGRAVDWWSADSRKQFTERSQCLVQQANSYPILPGLFVNGERTITENVADQGGTKLAYAVYLRRKQLRGPTPELGGYNSDQQFFIAFAQSWCAKRTEESMRAMISGDTHPPENFRVNVSLQNRPEFSQAFTCREGSDPMAPTNRCDIW